MAVGISTSCFYPQPTEQAMQTLGEIGVKVAEVFINARAELRPPLLDELLRIQRHYGMRIPSLHPWMSFAEGYIFFSEYERRFLEALDDLKHYFEAANRLGADILVFHGAKMSTQTDPSLYIDRFSRIAQEGKRCGVRVAQENVVEYLAESPAFLRRMQREMGELFHMVLDIKQTRRSGIPYKEFLGSLLKSIVHVHISDCNSQESCLPPGEGNFPFRELFEAFCEAGYPGDYVIELYRNNFCDAIQLQKAFQYALQIGKQ